MSRYIFLPEQRPAWETFCYYKNGFSEEECQKILDLGLQIPTSAGLVGQNTVDESTRKAKIGWVNWAEDVDWIFKKLGEFVHDANNARYKFNLMGFLEPLQFTHYDELGSHYDWHQDIGSGFQAQRKLSVVVQLTKPEDYEGSELEVFGGVGVPKEKGSVIIFPSYQNHRVTELQKGSRHSLVAWVSGPPYV